VRLLPKDKGLGWVPYVWLVYLAGVPLNAWLTQIGAWQWAASLLGMAVFLVLYFLGYHAGQRTRMWISAAIGLLGVCTAPINSGAAVYFIYAAAFVGMAADTRCTLRALGLLLAAIAGVTLLFHLTPFFWVPAAVFSVMIGAINTNFTQRQRDQKRLLLAQEEVERMAQIAERERIARDLHDVLGHTLSVIALKSELASKLAETDPARSVQEIRDVERISREALGEVRSTVRSYQARSFRAEMARAEAVLRAAGVKVNCSVTEATIPPAHEGVLALVLREAVTNVIRHAKASTCDLCLHLADGVCRLEIRDDGCGHLAPEGAGLTGIRSRVEALGGHVRREVAAGTQLIITLPVPSA
jgi:two-component system, NarL family, sensor histidine kinase DesK